MRLPNGERREWIKPIMFSGGLGSIEDRHVKKEAAQPGMYLIYCLNTSVLFVHFLLVVFDSDLILSHKNCRYVEKTMKFMFMEF